MMSFIVASASAPYTVPTEVERALHGPDLVVSVGRVQLSRIADGHPGDGNDGARGKSGVDLNDGVDAHLGALTDDRAGKDGCSRGDERTGTDCASVDVRVRPDHDLVADNRGVTRSPANHRVLQYHDVGADHDRAVLGRQHGAVHDA